MCEAKIIQQRGGRSVNKKCNLILRPQEKKRIIFVVFECLNNNFKTKNSHAWKDKNLKKKKVKFCIISQRLKERMLHDFW